MTTEEKALRQRIWLWTLVGGLSLGIAVALSAWDPRWPHGLEALFGGGPLGFAVAILIMLIVVGSPIWAYFAILVATWELTQALNRGYDWLGAAIGLPYLVPQVLTFLKPLSTSRAREPSFWEVSALGGALVCAQVAFFQWEPQNPNSVAGAGMLSLAVLLFAVRVAFDLTRGGPLARLGLIGYALIAGSLAYGFVHAVASEGLEIVGPLAVVWLLAGGIGAAITFTEAERRGLTSPGSWGLFAFVAPFAAPLVLGLLPGPNTATAAGASGSQVSERMSDRPPAGPPVQLAFGYMEVSGNERVSALCSDEACPCGYPGATIPRGQGYVYVSPEVADFRAGCPTEAEARMKIQALSRATGALVVAGTGVFAPILMCEQGARKRALDLEVAAADARHWWQTGQVRIRPTPLVQSPDNQPRSPEREVLPALSAKGSLPKPPGSPLAALAAKEKTIRDRPVTDSQVRSAAMFAGVSTPPIGGISYRNAKWGLSLTYPPGWEVAWEDEPDGGWEIAVGIAGMPSRSGRPFVSIRVLRQGLLNRRGENGVVQAAGGPGPSVALPRTAAEYNAGCKSELQGLFPELRILAEETGTLAGMASARLLYSYRSKTGRIRETQVNLLGKEVTYRLLCEAPEEQAEAVEGVFDSVLANFAPFAGS